MDFKQLLNIEKKQKIMKKIIYSLIITAIFFLGIKTSSVMAQGSLEFSRVLLVDNTEQTVPADKVWKITAITGRTVECFNFSEFTSSRPFAMANWSGFELNGELVIHQILYHDPVFCGTNCSGMGGTSCVNFSNDRDYTYDTNNLFPMWLPESTALKTADSAIKLSVIEFNIVP